MGLQKTRRSIEEPRRIGFGSFGFERPFDDATLKRLYKDKSHYVERFNLCLDGLISEGWFLPEDAEEFRTQAQQVVDPF